MATWVNNIDYIEDGVDIVRAEDTNRPLEQLDSRTGYLFEAIQAASLGELILARNVTLSEALSPGAPVWFDTSDGLWKPATAVLTVSEGNDFGFAAEESEVRGLVLVNHLGAGNTADVALYGRIRSDWAIDWDLVTAEGDDTPARYYLSTEEGKITRTRNVLSVEIGVLGADGSMVFTPNITGNLRSHLHLRFPLEAVQAMNLTQPGWGAAGLFANAPVGAAYGYNLSQNSDLSAKFPPMPIDNYFMSYNGVGLSTETVLVDANGIWWMDAVNTPFALGDHVYTDSVTHYFEFWMMQLNFGAKIVNTLREGLTGNPAGTLPVRVRALDGSSSDNGDLQLYLDQSVRTQTPSEDESAYAYKNITGVRAFKGPVISRLIPGIGVSIQGSHGDSETGFFGVVSVSSSAALQSVLNSSPTLVALKNAREDFFNLNIPVINLPNSRVSSFKLKIPIAPYLPSGLSLTLRLGVLSASLFSTTVQLYRMVVTPGVAVPSAPTLHQNLPVSVTPGNQNKLLLFNSSPITGLQPGDLLFLDVSKDVAIGNDIMFAVIDYNIGVGA